MKRYVMSLWSVFVILLMAVLVLSACQQDVLPTITPAPSATATPRSTPLPEVPTAVPLASEGRPLTILMLPQGMDGETVVDEELIPTEDPTAIEEVTEEPVATEETTEELAATEAVAATEEGVVTEELPANEELAALIQEMTGLVVEVQLVNTYGEIVSQLCGTTPVVGWLGGTAFIVAEAQGCADPELLVERDGVTGFQVEMVMNTRHVGNEPDPGDVAQMADETLCRVVGDGAVDWQIVELMLRAGGVNPLMDLDEIMDVEDANALVTAVYEDDCAGGFLPAGTYPRRLSSEVRGLEELEEDVALITTSPVVPYDILVYPQIVPLNVRIPLTDIFMQLSTDDEYAAVLASILAQDSLKRVDREDFDEFRAFMNATGLDFAALGE